MNQQFLTSHQSQYIAWLLTRPAGGNSVGSFASTLVDSQVDLIPHQVDAALLACRQPLSRGVILADHRPGELPSGPQPHGKPCNATAAELVECEKT